MNNYKIGFIGYGKMAKSIASYLGKNESIGKMLASDPFIVSSEWGVSIINSNVNVVKNCDIVFLSIKPQNAVAAIADIDFSNKIVISIMAGVKLERLKALCTNCQKLVRVMPNLCAQVGESVNAFTSLGLAADERETVAELLAMFGHPYEVGEEYFDTITGLTGSGPAYVFRFVKNLIESGCEGGLAFEQSRNMTLDMLRGCASLLKSASDIAEIETMISNVCSKGGTTIEGIYALDAGNFDSVTKNAVESAIRRSRELSK